MCQRQCRVFGDCCVVLDLLATKAMLMIKRVKFTISPIRERRRFSKARTLTVCYQMSSCPGQGSQCAYMTLVQDSIFLGRFLQRCLFHSTLNNSSDQIPYRNSRSRRKTKLQSMRLRSVEKTPLFSCGQKGPQSQAIMFMYSVLTNQHKRQH